MALITLLTDFGWRDSYVAEVKGVLLSGAPDLTLIDLTHQVPPGDVRAAEYLLRRTWQRFPAGTIHLGVVDPGVGTERRALAVAAAGHFFIGPDNGIFTFIADRADAKFLTLVVPPAASTTFHGRDVFAPAAALLARRGWCAELGGRLQGKPVRLALPQPVRSGDEWRGEVIHVDHFGNLITNLPPNAVGPSDTVQVAGVNVGSLRTTFGDVPPGDWVVYPGSDRTLEIAVRDGSAAAKLNAGVSAEVSVKQAR